MSGTSFAASFAVRWNKDLTWPTPIAKNVSGGETNNSQDHVKIEIWEHDFKN